MDIGQAILDAIAAETTVINSVIAYIQNTGTINETDRVRILEEINANRQKLQEAIEQNT